MSSARTRGKYGLDNPGKSIPIVNRPAMKTKMPSFKDLIGKQKFPWYETNAAGPIAKLIDLNKPLSSHMAPMIKDSIGNRWKHQGNVSQDNLKNKLNTNLNLHNRAMTHLKKLLFNKNYNTSMGFADPSSDLAAPPTWTPPVQKYFPAAVKDVSGYVTQTPSTPGYSSTGETQLAPIMNGNINFAEPPIFSQYTDYFNELTRR
jgi:hypothetical protein